MSFVPKIGPCLLLQTHTCMVPSILSDVLLVRIDLGCHKAAI